jgi:hypothetical protein
MRVQLVVLTLDTIAQVTEMLPRMRRACYLSFDQPIATVFTVQFHREYRLQILEVIGRSSHFCACPIRVAFFSYSNKSSSSSIAASVEMR